ncbi:serine hydrolase domain-containing protein [Leptothoe sp. LEGE 181152]|nr:serine hydrolase domain-containing protein [Leptothoe sp. LEGE 181152]
MELPASGYAWTSLEPKVDELIKKLMQAEKLPGMTVAVTKNGRLIVAKGYGWANAETKQTMEPFMSSRIGSVTKAVVTGPAGWQLMRAKGINPQQQKLYGPSGLFKNRFAEDIELSPTPNKNWYYQITLQHLLDHAAGFYGSGSLNGAAAMFNIKDKALVTYEHIHKHFLRTQQLIFQPGTNSEYANHSLGIWTLVIEALSGKSYRDYAVNTYLRSLGLHEAVLPESTKLGNRQARSHVYNDQGTPVPIKPKNSGTGLAAGGFRASAQDLTYITADLENTYTGPELEKMAWNSNDRGKLAHGGLIHDSGTAYVAMFPDGYTSLNGVDLSRIHVAVATNINMKEITPLRKLVDQIVLAVPAANVPAHYDITQFLRQDTDMGGDFKEASLDGSIAVFSNSEGKLQLIPYRVNDLGTLTRGEVVTAGAASQVNLVHPDYSSADAVTAFRDANDNLKLIAWEISSSGQVTRRDDVVAGPVKRIALTPFPDGKGVITLTRGMKNDLKLVAWEMTPSLNIIRRGDIDAGPVQDIAVATTRADFAGVVSATTGSDRKLKLIAWSFNSAAKTFSRRGDAEAGSIKGELNIVRAQLAGNDIVVTAFSNEDANLKLITWQVQANGQIQRKASTTAGFASIVDLTAAPGGKVIASVKDSEGILRMIAYQVQSNGQIARVGTDIAGQVSRIASSAIRRDGKEFLLTAVRDTEKKLRMISWQLD